MIFWPVHWKHSTQSQVLSCCHVSNPYHNLALVSFVFHFETVCLITEEMLQRIPACFLVPDAYQPTVLLCLARPPSLSQMHFFLGLHQSVNLSSPCSTVAMWKSKGRWGWQQAEGWFEHELRGLPQRWRLSAPIYDNSHHVYTKTVQPVVQTCDS